MKVKTFYASIALIFFSIALFAQPKPNDVTTPLHLLKPDYPVPYGAPTIDNVTRVLNKVYNYLDAVTPPQFVDKRTGKAVSDLSNIDTNAIFKQGDFRLTSYEWGVTYSGMLLAGEATGDAKFTNYTKQRLQFIADAIPSFKALYQKYPLAANPLRQSVAPHALDDAGAMCAAMIKTLRAGGNASLRPAIDNLSSCKCICCPRLWPGDTCRR